MRGKGPRCRDRTSSGHDLPHTEVREGRVALNKGKNRSNGIGGVGSLFWKVLDFTLEFLVVMAIYKLNE